MIKIQILEYLQSFLNIYLQIYCTWPNWSLSKHNKRVDYTKFTSVPQQLQFNFDNNHRNVNDPLPSCGQFPVKSSYSTYSRIWFLFDLCIYSTIEIWTVRSIQLLYPIQCNGPSRTRRYLPLSAYVPEITRRSLLIPPEIDLLPLSLIAFLSAENENICVEDRFLADWWCMRVWFWVL